MPRAFWTASLSERPSALASHRHRPLAVDPFDLAGSLGLVDARPGWQAARARVRRGDGEARKSSAATCGTVCRRGARCRIVRSPLCSARRPLRRRAPAGWSRSSRRECPGRWPDRGRWPPVIRACGARGSSRRRSDRGFAKGGGLSLSEYSASLSISGPFRLRLKIASVVVRRAPAPMAETSLTAVRRSGYSFRIVRARFMTANWL